MSTVTIDSSSQPVRELYERVTLLLSVSLKMLVRELIKPASQTGDQAIYRLRKQPVDQLWPAPHKTYHTPLPPQWQTSGSPCRFRLWRHKVVPLRRRPCPRWCWEPGWRRSGLPDFRWEGGTTGTLARGRRWGRSSQCPRLHSTSAVDPGGRIAGHLKVCRNAGRHIIGSERFFFFFKTLLQFPSQTSWGHYWHNECRLLFYCQLVKFSHIYGTLKF